MPFNERFWRVNSIHDELFTWDAKSRAKESAPKGVQGFIVALPTTWTDGESNVSGMNNFLMAGNRSVPSIKGTSSLADENIMVAAQPPVPPTTVS